MKKKTLFRSVTSILCALAMLVSMATIAAVTVSADEPTLDKSFKPLSEATVTPDYGTESAYSYGFSGIFTDKATFGDGLVLDCGAPADAIPQGIAINYGNYNMQAFQFGAVLGYGALTKTHTGKNYGQTVVMKVGDLALTLTFSAKAGYAYNIAASYKGNPLELKNPADAVFTETAWGHSGKEYFGLADATAYHDAMLTNRGVDSTSISGDNLKGLWPKHVLPVAIGYENGVVTVYTGSGGNSTLKVAATATLTGADFSNANVSLTTKVTKGIWYIHNIGGMYQDASGSGSSSEDTSSEVTSSEDVSSEVTSSDTSSADPDPVVPDKAFKPLSEATVTPDTGSSDKYDIGSTGVFTNHATYGDGFVCESWRAELKGATLDYGNYNMKAFQFGAILGFRNLGAADVTTNGYQETVTLKVGDVSVTLTYVSNFEYAVSATYKGEALALKKADDTDFTKTSWNETGVNYGDPAYKDVHAAMLAARGVTSGFSVAGKWPNQAMQVGIGYADGVLTLYTGSGNSSTWKAAATATLADADFSDANVSLTALAGKGSWYVHNIGGMYQDASGSGTSSEDVSSEVTSSEDVSSDVTSSEDTSSDVTSSEDTSSDVTSSEDTSSDVTSSEGTSSDVTSSEPPREVVTTEMGGLDQATCEIPEDLNWNSVGSGLGKTSLTGDALFIGGSNVEVNLTANVGTYAIDSYFKLNFDLFAKTGSLKNNGIAEGNENWVVTVGDFEFAFTRPTLEEAKSNEHTMLKSVKYKGTELTIQGDTIYTPEHRVKHDYNDPKTVAAANEHKQYTEDKFGRLGWMFTNGLPEKANLWPTFHHSVEIVYDNGKITVTGGIGNDAGIDPAVATVDATSVVDTTQELGACEVSVNAHATAARKTYISAIGNFAGVYEKGTASIPDPDEKYTGLVNIDGVWYYVVDGEFCEETTLVNYYDVWYYVENGVLNWDYTGLVNYYGTWYYVENGVLNWGATTLTNYYGTWYYVENGILNWGATTLCNYYDTWYYVENGVLNWNATTLVNYYGTWYYVENGVLNWGATTLCNYYGTWYYVENGVLNWNATTLVNYYGTWYYVENGVLNWNATTLVNYYDTWYYVENGVLNWNYTGSVNYYGTDYSVVNGVVVF